MIQSNEGPAYNYREIRNGLLNICKNVGETS